MCPPTPFSGPKVCSAMWTDSHKAHLTWWPRPQRLTLIPQMLLVLQLPWQEGRGNAYQEKQTSGLRASRAYWLGDPCNLAQRAQAQLHVPKLALRSKDSLPKLHNWHTTDLKRKKKFFSWPFTDLPARTLNLNLFFLPQGDPHLQASAHDAVGPLHLPVHPLVTLSPLTPSLLQLSTPISHPVPHPAPTALAEHFYQLRRKWSLWCVPHLGGQGPGNQHFHWHPH